MTAATQRLFLTASFQISHNIPQVSIQPLIICLSAFLTETLIALMNTTSVMEGFLNHTSTTIASESSIGDVTWFRVLKYTLYGLMFLISMSGNIMVCLIITRRRKMKTITNFLILNLAISDVLYTLYVPLDIVITETTTWPFAHFFCHLLYPLMTLSICVSAFTLMALALSRFWAVVFPLRRQISIVQVKASLVTIWLLGIFEVLPYAIFLTVSDDHTCDENWPNEEWSKGYTLFLFFSQFVIPLTAITFAYTMVGIELKRGGRRTENRTLERTRSEESKKVIRMLVVITAAFAIFNLPTSIMWLINDFSSTKISGFNDIIAFFNLLDFGNAAVNPCIYLACNEDFRREFCRYLNKMKVKLFWSSERTFSADSAPSHDGHETGEEPCIEKTAATDPTYSILLKNESCM